MSKWKYQIFPKGIRFYSNALYRGELFTDRDIPQKHKRQLGLFLTKIINSYIKDKENE
jgi:hypothetical protein